MEPTGRASGLALLWSLGVELEVMYSDKNMITTLVYSDPPNSPWLLFAIYGPCKRNKRIMFWEMLENMVLSFSEPWIVIGTSWQTLELSTLVLMGRLSLGQIGVKV